jgi:subtilisin-like proprotein convertase family protein
VPKRKLIPGLLAAAVSIGLGPPSASADTGTASVSNTQPFVFQFCFGAGCPPAPYAAIPASTAVAMPPLPGFVTRVSVTLHNLALYSGAAGNVEAELEGPAGTSTLMAGAGGSSMANGIDLTFADGAPAIPIPISGGTFAPTQNTTPDIPSPAPSSSSADLSQFVGEDPAGVWRLWVGQHTTLESGTFGGGWTLNIAITPFGTSQPMHLGPPANPGDPAERADPYPSTLTVSGLSGVISSVRPTLAGITTSSMPDDLDFLLVSPRRASTLLMADAGGSAGVSRRSITFDDAAATAVPDGGPLTGGSFRPSQYSSGPRAVFLAPAPQPPYGTNLAALDGVSPNGTWSLYGINDQPAADATLGRGWALDITTRPASPVQFSQSTHHAVAGQNVTLTVTRSAPASGPATVNVATASGTALPGRDFTPVTATLSFAPGETRKTVDVPTLTRGAGGNFSVSLGDPTDDAAPAAPARATVTIAPGGGQGGAGAPAPVLSSLRLSRTSFRARAGRHDHRAGVGTKISYRDSQAAQTTFTVVRIARGVRRHRTCVLAGARRQGRACQLRRIVGHLVHRDAAGLNQLMFDGTLARRRLTPGRYVIVAQARSPATGRRSPAISRPFRIVR